MKNFKRQRGKTEKARWSELEIDLKAGWGGEQIEGGDDVVGEGTVRMKGNESSDW